MNTSHSPSPGGMVLPAVIVGAFVAGALGLLTFGVQATVRPDDVPLAIAVKADGPAAAPLRVAAERVAAQGHGQVAWQITSADNASQLLDDKKVYGVLELAPAPPQGLTATVVVSGAVNPSGTQLAQQVLTGAAQAVTAAQGQDQAKPSPVEIRTVHPATPAGRTAPLAASALLWIGTLVAAVLITVPTLRGARVRPGVRLLVAAGSAVTVTAGVWGLLKLWESGLSLDLPVIGFLLLVAFAFAAVQGSVFRLLGFKGIALLAPLYLMAPSVAGQVPELLHPAYRAGLWSWTPFRFSTEGLRSLLQLDHVAPDVWTAVWVFGVMAAAATVVLIWPRRAPQPAALRSHAAGRGPALRT